MPAPVQHLVVLTEADKLLLQKYLDKASKQPINTTNRPRVEDDIPQAPEVYIALTPEDGIPAASDVSPGRADCEPAQLIFTGADTDPGTGDDTIDTGYSDALIGMGFTIEVHNLSEFPVQGNSWILAVRDKLGRWVVAYGPADEGDALTVDIPTQICPVFTRITASQTVNVVTGIIVEKTSFTFPPQTTRGTIKCYLNPHNCCEIGTGSGTATGHPGTGTHTGPGVSLPCCPGVLLPAQMCLTASGSAVGVDGNYTLTYGVMPGSVYYGWVSGPWSYSGTTYTWIVQCAPNGWVVTLSCDSGAYSTGRFATTACSPLALSDVNGFLSTGPCVLPNMNLGLIVSVASGPCGGGGGGGGGISRSSLGTTNSGGLQVASLTLSGRTLPAASLLVVNVLVPSCTADALVSFNGVSMTLDKSINNGSTNDKVFVFSQHLTALTTGSIVVTFSAGSHQYCLMSAVEVLGLATFAVDQSIGDWGLSSNPDTSTTSSTATAAEYAQALFGLKSPSSPLWVLPFIDGGQAVGMSIGAVLYGLLEGYRVLSSIDTVEAQMTGVPASWEGIAATYR